MSLTSELLGLARSAGADAVGVAGAEPFSESRERIRASVRAGLSGPLGFTYGDPELASDIRASLPWAESLVVFGVSYIDEAKSPGDRGPLVGRFATNDFYHPVREVASVLADRLEQAGARTEILIDDNRLVDRSAAIRAGVGWLGRSTMLLTPGAGPWMLLGTVATDAALECSEPMSRDCGACTACIPACPTGAISDGVLDARRCLSTWLQTPGSIPHWVRPLLGRRIYGCDDCLTSCPPGHPSLRSAPSVAADWSFDQLLSRDDDQLLQRFSWWFVPRRDGRYIRRNLIVAAGNSREEGALEILIEHLSSPSSMIRGHAAWAIARSGPPDAVELIGMAYESETTAEGRDEMLLSLLMLEQPGLYAEVLERDEHVTMSRETTGLGLVGDFDTRSPGQSNLRIMTVGEGALEIVDQTELSEAVRVNDRERILERMRRQARARLDGSG